MRFGAMAALAPQTILWEIERYYPAGTVVEATTAPSRWDDINTFHTDKYFPKLENKFYPKFQRTIFSFILYFLSASVQMFGFFF